MDADPITLTLDTGALIAIDERNKAMIQRIRVAMSEGGRVIVPSAVVAEWRRGGPASKLTAGLLDEMVVPRDDRTIGEHAGAALLALAALALAALALAARSGAPTSPRPKGSVSVTDALVMATAAHHAAIVYTNDPEDLETLRVAYPLFAAVEIRDIRHL